MGDHDHRTGKTPQVVLQPLNHGNIQMVRRLIQNQHITWSKQNSHQSRPFPLTAGKFTDLLFQIQDAEPSQQGSCPGLNISYRRLGCSALIGQGTSSYCRQHIKLRIKVRGLGKITDHKLVLLNDLSLIRLLLTCQDPKKGGLTGSVDTDDSDLFSFLQGKGCFLQKHPACITLTDLFCIDNAAQTVSPAYTNDLNPYFNSCCCRFS